MGRQRLRSSPGSPGQAASTACEWPRAQTSSPSTSARGERRRQYPPATGDDLVETVRLVEGWSPDRGPNRRRRAFLRSHSSAGRCCRAGGMTCRRQRRHQQLEPVLGDARTAVADVVGVKLTGVWKTLTAATPIMIDQIGGIDHHHQFRQTNSVPAQGHYSAAKHGLVGCARRRRSSSVRTTSGQHDSPVGCQTPMATMRGSSAAGSASDLRGVVRTSSPAGGGLVAPDRRHRPVLPATTDGSSALRSPPTWAPRRSERQTWSSSDQFSGIGIEVRAKLPPSHDLITMPDM